MVNYATKPFQIAYEWDQMEKALQADDFWMFLSNDPRRGQNRIGLLFEHIFETEGSEEDRNSDDLHRVFLFYYKRLNGRNDSTASEEWKKIRNLFQLFEDWFLDHRLFHIIGFMVHQGTPLTKIQNLRENASSRDAFERILRERILETSFNQSTKQKPINDLRKRVDDDLNNLSYPESRIRSLLLLFNIATLLSHPKSNMRFQFDRFKVWDGKRYAWDVEHIRSVTSPETGKEREDWLKQCREYLDPGKDKPYPEKDRLLVDRIDHFLGKDDDQTTDADFGSLYDELLSRIEEKPKGTASETGEKDDEGDGIGNLTLLDAATNRSYKNAFFAVKRRRILQLDEGGTFLPLCTRNAFLKVYNPQSDHLLGWMPEDSRMHREKMKDTLVEFFAKEGNPS